jgi:hypothetical protein
MKKTYLKKIGKQGKINIEANQKLREIYYEKGIGRCEIRFVGCLGSFTSGFAHKHKRSWYYGKPELLASFDETVLACSSCHDKIENSKKLTEMVFKMLRNKKDPAKGD